MFCMHSQSMYVHMYRHVWQVFVCINTLIHTNPDGDEAAAGHSHGRIIDYYHYTYIIIYTYVHMDSFYVELFRQIIL